MRRHLGFICSALLLGTAMLLPQAASAQAVSNTSRQEVVTATLVSEYAGIQPGKPLHLGVLLEPKAGWHTYWENPGDAGMPTSMKWTLPEGFSADTIEWPAPKRITEVDLVTHSYDESVFLPVTIHVPETLDATHDYKLEVKATWLVCKDICIPESADMSISLPVADGMPAATQNASLFAAHNAVAPKPLSHKVAYTVDGQSITLHIPLSEIGGDNVASAVFFPRQYNVYKYSADQIAAIKGHILNLRILRSNDAPRDDTSGLLTVTMKDNTQQHFDIVLNTSAAAIPAGKEQASPQVSQPAEGGMASEGPGAFLGYILLAIAGGVILNLMPCVLPVLSLKTLAIAKKAGEAPAKVRKLGLAYTLGILVSFGIITGILLVLRNAGEAIGWGYQMQSPAFIGFLSYLLFMVGLNLSGLFDLPVLFGSAATKADDSSLRGSFYTGILATMVATPCTAPFMATAVGAALTMSSFKAILIFEALGLGLAAPFLLVSYFPALLRFLPKPGAWMERFRQFLAFPMYASVIWLVWVLVLQTGPGGLVIILSGMLALVILIWLRTFFQNRGHLYRLIALGGSALVIILSLPMLEHMQASQQPGTPLHEQYGVDEVAYTPQTLEKLRSEGKPIFLDATAAWCLTCQINGKVAIHTKATMELFKEKGITLMIADWTRASSDITALLGSFGHKGVPLYVYYPPNGGTPEILPQILSEAIIKNRLSQ